MMNLRTIALKNIQRRKGKMALVIFGLGLAVATLVSVVTIVQSFERTVDRKLDEYGFNIIIFPKSKQVVLEYGGIALGGVNSYRAPALGEGEVGKIAAFAKSGKIRAYSQKLLSIIEIKNKKVLAAGVNLSNERRVKKWWMVEAGRYPKAAGEVFIGQTAAEKLGLEMGDQVRIAGKTMRVVGILMQTGSQDDELVFVDIRELRRLTGKAGEVSLIEVAAGSSADVGALTAALSKALPTASVRSVMQALKFKENAFGHLVKFGFGVTAVVALISALIVFTMMASVVNERRAEIGIFRAIGFRKVKIASIILTEAAVVGVAGGLVGYVLGFGLAQAFVAFGKEASVIMPSVPVMSGALAMSVCIGLLASIIPAQRAANLDPVESLKSL